MSNQSKKNNKARPYIQFCATLRQHDLLRALPKTTSTLYDFSTNDYLNFSQHPHIIHAATQAANQYGVGAKASRLITSSQQSLIELEQEIAKAKQMPASLIFSSGFQANISVISALLDRKVLGAPPLVFADKLNHASMHAGCQLAKIKQMRYRHNDMEHLRWLLSRYQTYRQPRFILTESVFGMDGDIANLPALIALAKQYNALLFVDEAHATGLFGAHGYGCTSDFKNEIDISMGTFSKALGGTGAYVACSSSLKKYFINRCSGLIFSTALSPMQVAAMHAAWRLVPSHKTQVNKLLQDAIMLRQNLREMGFDVGNSTSHIIPIMLKNPKITLHAQAFLKTRGVQVAAIRPPSVPPNMSRLRIALSLAHSTQAYKELLNALKAFKEI